MDAKKTFLSWPVVRQLSSRDFLGRGPSVTSRHTRELTPRTDTADRVVQSICPYCAVGCSLVAYTRQSSDGSVQLLQIEGDPDSPVYRLRVVRHA